MCLKEKPCELAMFCMAGTRAVVYLCPTCGKDLDALDSYPPLTLVSNCAKEFTIVYGKCNICFAKKVVWQEE